MLYTTEQLRAVVLHRFVRLATPKTMPKYTTITELAAAFKSGELDSSYHLVIDKGGCSLRLRQDGPPTEDSEEAEETESKRYQHCRELFRREYDCPLEELFTLAGIPAEWA